MSLNSPNFDVKSIFFPHFGQGPFPKIAGKGPDLFGDNFKDGSFRPLVKSAYQKIFFLFLNQNLCCGYSKELSQ